MPASNSAAYQTRLMVLLSISFGFVFLDRNAFTNLSPFIAPELKLNNTDIGYLTSALSLTWALGGYFISRLSDSSGKRKSLLLLTYVVFSVSSFMSGLAQSFIMLMCARMLMGLAEGPILPISQSLMALESDASKRGNAMGVMQNFGSNFIGSFVAPLLLVWIATTWNWRAAFYVAAIPGLIMATLMWKYIREPANRVVTAAVAAAEGPKLGVLQMLAVRNIWLCVLICCCMVAWMVLGWAFLPPYYVNVRHIAPTEMSVLMSVLGISAAAFAFVVPRLSDTFGRKPILILFCIAGALVPAAVHYFQGSHYVLGALIFLGWSASGAIPILMATVPAETLSARYIATSTGLVMGLGELIGGVSAPTVAGMAADRYGLPATMLIMAGCAIMGGLLAFFLKETAPVKVGARLQPAPAF